MAAHHAEGKKKGLWSTLKSTFKGKKEAKPAKTREAIEPPSPESQHRPHPFYAQPRSTFDPKPQYVPQQYPNPQRSPLEPPSPERRPRREYAEPKTLYHRKSSAPVYRSQPALSQPHARRFDPDVAQRLAELAMADSNQEDRTSEESAPWPSHFLDVSDSIERLPALEHLMRAEPHLAFPRQAHPRNHHGFR